MLFIPLNIRSITGVEVGDSGGCGGEGGVIT